MSTIKQIIQELADKQEEVYSVVGEVIGLEGTRCDVRPLNGTADIFDVRLEASEGNAVIVYPKMGSQVVITFISKEAAYLALASEVDKIELGRKALEKVVKGESLNKNLEQLIDQFQALLLALSTESAELISIASSVPIFGPLAVPWTVLQGKLTPIQSTLNVLKPKLKNHLSGHVKTQ